MSIVNKKIPNDCFNETESYIRNWYSKNTEYEKYEGEYKTFIENIDKFKNKTNFSRDRLIIIDEYLNNWFENKMMAKDKNNDEDFKEFYNNLINFQNNPYHLLAREKEKFQNDCFRETESYIRNWYLQLDEEKFATFAIEYKDFIQTTEQFKNKTLSRHDLIILDNYLNNWFSKKMSICMSKETSNKDFKEFYENLKNFFNNPYHLMLNDQEEQTIFEINSFEIKGFFEIINYINDWYKKFSNITECKDENENKITEIIYQFQKKIELVEVIQREYVIELTKNIRNWFKIKFPFMVKESDDEDFKVFYKKCLKFNNISNTTLLKSNDSSKESIYLQTEIIIQVWYEKKIWDEKEKELYSTEELEELKNDYRKYIEAITQQTGISPENIEDFYLNVVLKKENYLKSWFFEHMNHSSNKRKLFIKSQDDIDFIFYIYDMFKSLNEGEFYFKKFINKSKEI